MKIIGVLLAGGESRRFGQNKCLALLKGCPLIKWVYQSLRQVCDEVWLSTRSEGEESKSFLNFEKIIEDYQPGQGPLLALFGALKYLTDNDLLLLVPCDQPFLVQPLLHHLLAKAQEATYQAVICLNQHSQILPFPGVYRASLLQRVPPKNCQRSFRSFLQSLRIKKISPKEWQKFDPLGFSFFNINYPADLQKAERLLKEYRLFE